MAAKADRLMPKVPDDDAETPGAVRIRSVANTIQSGDHDEQSDFQFGMVVAKLEPESDPDSDGNQSETDDIGTESHRSPDNFIGPDLPDDDVGTTDRPPDGAVVDNGFTVEPMVEITTDCEESDHPSDHDQEDEDDGVDPAEEELENSSDDLVLPLLSPTERPPAEEAGDGTLLACPMCDEAFENPKQFVAHAMTHGSKPAVDVEPAQFPCQACDRVFAKPYSLTRHLQAEHQGPYECQTCKLLFDRRSLLIDHYTIHPPPAYTCDRCPKTFTTDKSIQAHRKRVHGVIRKRRAGTTPETRFKCEDCDQTFPDDEQLQIHAKDHDYGWNRYKCTKCRKGYAHPWFLERHIRRQHDPRPAESSTTTMKGSRGRSPKHHRCVRCSKGFRARRLLRLHLRTEHKVKEGDLLWATPYNCEQCGELFRSLTKLVLHARRCAQAEQEEEQPAINKRKPRKTVTQAPATD